MFALIGLVLALISIVFPAAAQVGTRVTISAADNDDIEDAFGFNPDVAIVVNNAETATIDGSDPDHLCLTPDSQGGHSVWFVTTLVAGALTLNTTDSSYSTVTTPSTDTVISLYRYDENDVPDNGFDGPSELTPLTCSDNGAGPGIISNFPIPYLGTYYIQVSAAPTVVAIAPSTVELSAGFTATVPHPNDEPRKAKAMKLPNLPGMSNINSATISLTEPVDPLAPGPVTNTVWAKFTLTSKRVVGFQNFYYNAGTLFFSLFTKSGNDYNPATGEIVSFPDVMLATLSPGTYYLRIGVLGEPEGTSSTFITFTGIAYLMPFTYEFSAGFSEGAIGATASQTGWKLSKATSGPAGDGVFCETSGPYDCYFRFISAGAGERTQLKAKLKLNAVKLNKGDVIRLQPSLSDSSGQPNFRATLVLTNAAGAKQTYVLNVTDGINTEPNLTATVKQGFTPVQATLTLKNNDKDLGDFVEIDGVVVAALRIGAGLRDTLSIPLIGNVPAGWAPQSEAQGVLPLPLPAQ
jgi:hypothetical protein